jgi:hypothetical protein
VRTRKRSRCGRQEISAQTYSSWKQTLLLHERNSSKGSFSYLILAASRAVMCMVRRWELNQGKLTRGNKLELRLSSQVVPRTEVVIDHSTSEARSEETGREEKSR